jgi:hypothetical protein
MQQPINFVHYEQALALKELGFDELCFGYYIELRNPVEGLLKIGLDNDYLQAPLYQQAFRWFREKYNIDAWVQPFTLQKSNGDLYLPDGTYSYFIFKYGVLVRDGVNFLEPEEAELACLKNLIEIVKQQTHATTN